MDQKLVILFSFASFLKQILNCFKDEIAFTVHLFSTGGNFYLFLSANFLSAASSILRIR